MKLIVKEFLSQLKESGELDRLLPDLLSRIATDLVCHELYVWCSQKGNFSLRARARQYAEVAYHVKPEYRMPAEQRDAL